MIGIYKITNLINGKIYIGQSNNIRRRFEEHKSLTSTAHSAIRSSLQKYGVANFSFDVLEECSLEKLDEREAYWIAHYNSFGDGYNLNPGGDQLSIGEFNGRAILTTEEVIQIRKSYLNREKRREVYQKYKDKITFNTFAGIWDGTHWPHVMPEVFTQESKDYYSKQATNGERSNTASFTNEEVLLMRTRYISETAREIHQTCSDRCSYQTLQSILWGRTYKEVPVYSKKKKEWISL